MKEFKMDFYSTTNLKSYNLEVVERVLKKYDQDLSVRAENITLEEFIEMSNELCKEK